MQPPTGKPHTSPPYTTPAAEKAEQERKALKEAIYSTTMEIDRHERVVAYSPHAIADLDARLTTPTLSAVERRKLQEERDFRQQNLEQARAELAIAKDKLRQLEPSGRLP
jgi:hypothetical protein